MSHLMVRHAFLFASSSRHTLIILASRPRPQLDPLSFPRLSRQTREHALTLSPTRVHPPNVYYPHSYPHPLHPYPASSSLHKAHPATAQQVPFYSPTPPPMSTTTSLLSSHRTLATGSACPVWHSTHPPNSSVATPWTRWSRSLLGPRYITQETRETVRRA